MTKSSLDIYKVGSRVKLTDDVDGTIISVNIGANNSVTYECGWWNGRSYTKDYFSASHIETTVADRVRIGFA
jgi:uncharacterized protein YodC (DUF2158 family)